MKRHQRAMRLPILVGAVVGLLIPAGCTASDKGTVSADSSATLVAHVLGDTEDVWGALFRSLGKTPYPAATGVLFSGAARSACGLISAAEGPTYCPADQRIYIAPAFLRELSGRIGATGDFAQAYLIAHEVGHHVQNVLGTMKSLDARMRELDERQRNQLQLRLELQADCYAGIWTHFVQKRGLLEAGDLEKGFPAALAVGHASALGEQRVRWFKRGLSMGDPRQCDTFREAN